jgi:hypothetical protein
VTVAQSNQVRIDYDDHPEDVVEKINAALCAHGLALVDDGQSHDGYVLLTLQAIESSSKKVNREL